jgi:hypothetical protein
MAGVSRDAGGAGGLEIGKKKKLNNKLRRERKKR